jgi:hypothetical protein
LGSDILHTPRGKRFRFHRMQVAEVTTADIVDQFGKKSFWKKMAWAMYLAAVGLATIGWLGLISYLALALSGY